MLHALFWFPLLGLFIGLAWAGWNEFQKLAAYKLWAENFERSKYDIYAILGQSGNQLTFGRPTRQGPVDLTQVDLATVQDITLWAKDKPIGAETELPQGKVVLRLTCVDHKTVEIPFTDSTMALKWQRLLKTGADGNSPPQSSSSSS